jgi:hypothetical protein
MAALHTGCTARRLRAAGRSGTGRGTSRRDGTRDAPALWIRPHASTDLRVFPFGGQRGSVDSPSMAGSDVLVAVQVIASNPPNWIAYIALGVSGFALFISGASLWQSQLSPIRVLVASGPLDLRISPFRDSKSRWFIVDGMADFTFTNAGARPGTVHNLRLRLDYPEVPVPEAHEYLRLAFEVDPREYDKRAEYRLAWIDEAALGPGSPFILLPKESQTKRLIFSTRWEEPVIQDSIIFTLEIYSDQSREWKEFTSWKHFLAEDMWVRLANDRGAVAAYPNNGPVREDPRAAFPPDLHNYTRAKKELPKSIVWEPSYLDYGGAMKRITAIMQAWHRLTRRIRSRKHSPD